MAGLDKNSIPNYLTYARIVAIPIVMLLLLSGDDTARWFALVLYILAAATDYLDGYLARKWKVVSPIGRMLDPIADKLLVGALLLVFSFDHSFGVWDLIPATIILLREIFISGLREFMGTEKIVVPVSKLAKYKTAVQLVALGLVIAETLIANLSLISDVFLWLAAILTFVTGYQYWLVVLAHFKNTEKKS